MKTESRELEALFVPPPGEFGTHLLLCGLSADTETLERIMSAFSSETGLQRSASGILRGLLMLDASAPLMSPLSVPGMLQLAPCDASTWKAKTSLMHAKVALMGFAPSQYAEPSGFRLVVSTGNWTRESWGAQSQIDFFWTVDWRRVDGVDAKDSGDEARADIASSLAFFQQMLDGLYTQSHRYLQRQELALGWLRTWEAIIGAKQPVRRPRFIHSLEETLFRQIKKRFPKQGIARLIAGSGFFEQGKPGAGSKPEVLAKLESLGTPTARHLVYNPRHAGALAGWIAANRKNIKRGKLEAWEFRVPTDPLLDKPGPGRTRLHAKYIVGLKQVSHDKKATGTIGALYIGSGNLSRAGLLSHARLSEDREAHGSPGNIEAGIFFVEGARISQVWQKFACGEVQSDEEIDEAQMEEGEPMFVPRDPPPVLFARLSNGELELMRSGAAEALAVRLSSVGEWINISPDQQAIEFPNALVPPVVWVRRSVHPNDLAAPVYEVPVFSDDGLVCRQPVPQAPVEDILEALRIFPATPPHLPDPETVSGNGNGGMRGHSAILATAYPLKVMASLVEAIAQRNTMLAKEQFPVWLSQLRVYLLEQTADADIAAVRSLGIDLFPALSRPGFVPDWLAQEPGLKAAYKKLIGEVREAWCESDAHTL